MAGVVFHYVCSHLNGLTGEDLRDAILLQFVRHWPCHFHKDAVAEMSHSSGVVRHGEAETCTY